MNLHQMTDAALKDLIIKAADELEARAESDVRVAKAMKEANRAKRAKAIKDTASKVSSYVPKVSISFGR